jgi:hypothetical protein
MLQLPMFVRRREREATKLLLLVISFTPISDMREALIGLARCKAVHKHRVDLTITGGRKFC